MEKNYFFIGIAITFGIVGLICIYQDRNLIFKHSEKNIAAEKAEQMYYEEMFPQSKINLIEKEPKPFIILPAYDKKFILMHPELKEYFVGEVPAERIFSTKLNIDFADGTWQHSVHKHEIARAQFSKDGKYVLVSGIKEGNAVINISREGEVYGGNILVKVEEPEEWYKKWQEEIKLYK